MKYMKRHKGTFDMFIGIDHRIRKKEVQQRGQARMEVRSRRDKEN